MKHFHLNPGTPVKWIASLVVIALTITFSSCKKDDNNPEPTKPAPTVTVNPTSASDLAGKTVTTTVTVESPEGGKTLKIQVNGQTDSSLPDVTLDGTTSQQVPISWTIPNAAATGATYLVTFQASDKKDQQSLASTFLVTVSAVPAKPVVQIQQGNITEDTHWTADNIYVLNGFVRVGEDTHTGPGDPPTVKHVAVLTIDAGTIIMGKKGTPGGTLVVQRGSKLIAVGTADKPIVFTSDQAIGNRKSGDWGGVVICGKAPNNTQGSTSTGTDGIEELEGAYGGFHGDGANSAADDNSGTLQYVRIEYAGYPINPNQELNGITFGSVGSGTTLDHIQSTYSNDDSFEWFGGTVNAKNLIAYKGLDDDFDTDNGFSGHVQFGIALRDPQIADQSGSNGFESDNDANGTNHEPFTAAEFSNMTIIGGKMASGTTIDLQFQNGAQIRRQSKEKIINSFFTGFPNGLYIDATSGSPTCVDYATSGDVVIANNIYAGVENWGGNGYGTKATDDEIAVFTGVDGFPYGTNANHPNNPRGLITAGGKGAFANGAFAYSNLKDGTGATIGLEQSIDGTSPVLWIASNNTMLTKWTDSGLDASVFDPLSATPTFLPAAGKPLSSDADFTGFSNAFFDKTVSYRGAFGTTDWTTGWTNWTPQQTDYSH